MKCKFHPSAPAASTCDKCEVPLCGFCTNILGEKTYCEKCAEEAQLESYVELRSSTESDQVDSLLAEAESAITQTFKTEPEVGHNSGSKEKLHISLVLFCCVIIVYQIVGSFGDQSMLSPQQILTEDRTRNQIEACMLVFWEIAEELSAGRSPADSLRCDDTGLPLIVANVNGDLRISHPRPDLLGLTDIYITRSNPVPILVE